VDVTARARILAACPLFSGVAEPELSGLAEQAQPRRYRRGQLVFCEGDSGDSLLVVVEGSLKVTSSRADGGEFLLAVTTPNEAIGQLAVADGGPRSATVSTITDATVLRIPREAVLAAAATSPALTRALLAALAALARRLTGSAADLAFLDIPRRVAKLVLSRAAPGGDGATRLTQAEMAAAVGASRQSLNAALQDFQRRGWLTVRPGKIELTDPDALRRFTGD
jgi:CRP/FNR family transcriptional regulator, cyclic AMP receptor protein